MEQRQSRAADARLPPLSPSKPCVTALREAVSVAVQYSAAQEVAEALGLSVAQFVSAEHSTYSDAGCR